MSTIDHYAIACQDGGLTPDQLVLHAQMLLNAKKLCIERENSRGEMKLEFVSVDPSHIVWDGNKVKAIRFMGVDYDPSHLVPDQDTRAKGLKLAMDIAGADAKYRLAKAVAKLPGSEAVSDRAAVTVIRPERKPLPGQDTHLMRPKDGEATRGS